MKERGILFSAPMVRALLDGTKTQTRRIVKDQVIGERYTETLEDGQILLEWLGTPCCGTGVWDVPEHSAKIISPYGKPGDRLWVRETWRHTANSLEEARAITEDIASGTAVDWRATYIERCMKDLGFSREDAEVADSFERWRPSIHMPRWASRILLEVVSVRIERLQDISAADAWAEGIPHSPDVNPAHEYEELWEDINGAGSWDANPWVWVIEFKRVD